MAEAEWRPVMHPAGTDNELRVALEEVAFGRWMAVRTLLAGTDTSRSWATWTYRSQVFAAAAAGSDVVEAWAADQPDGAATVMLARVASERALRAYRSRHPNADALWHTALAACRTAAHAAPDNPVPWTCFLALAVIDEEQQASEHRVKAADPMLPPGPWGLLQRAHTLDPYNREAYHRMLQYWLARPDNAAVSHADGFARWVLSRAEQPAATPLLVLPVYVRVERWLRMPREALDMHWLNGYAIQDALTAYHGWFTVSTESDRSVQDLNYLAHALWAGQQYTEAGQVFRAMGQHITPRPWQYRLTDPGDRDMLIEHIARCRSQCLSVAQRGADPMAQNGSGTRAGPVSGPAPGQDNGSGDPGTAPDPGPVPDPGLDTGTGRHRHRPAAAPSWDFLP